MSRSLYDRRLEALADRGWAAGASGRRSRHDLVREMAAYALAVIGDGARAYYRLDELTGQIRDSIGSNHSNTTTALGYGAAGLIPGDNPAVSFNGTSAYYTVPDANAIDLGDVLSIEFWIKTTSSAQQWIIEKGTNAYGVALSGASGGGTGKVHFAQVNVDWIAYSKNRVDDGLVHHVVVTKNGATRRVYVDGVDQTDTTKPNLTLTNTATDLFIGARRPGTREWTNGTLDEISLYPTALTAAQVLAHYNAAGFATAPQQAGLFSDYSLAADQIRSVPVNLEPSWFGGDQPVSPPSVAPSYNPALLAATFGDTVGMDQLRSNAAPPIDPSWIGLPNPFDPAPVTPTLADYRPDPAQPFMAAEPSWLEANAQTLLAIYGVDPTDPIQTDHELPLAFAARSLPDDDTFPWSAIVAAATFDPALAVPALAEDRSAIDRPAVWAVHPADANEPDTEDLFRVPERAAFLPDASPQQDRIVQPTWADLVNHEAAWTPLPNLTVASVDQQSPLWPDNSGQQDRSVQPTWADLINLSVEALLPRGTTDPTVFGALWQEQPGQERSIAEVRFRPDDDQLGSVSFLRTIASIAQQAALWQEQPGRERSDWPRWFTPDDALEGLVPIVPPPSPTTYLGALFFDPEVVWSWGFTTDAIEPHFAGTLQDWLQLTWDLTPRRDGTTPAVLIDATTGDPYLHLTGPFIVRAD